MRNPRPRRQRPLRPREAQSFVAGRGRVSCGWSRRRQRSARWRAGVSTGHGHGGDGCRNLRPASGKWRSSRDEVDLRPLLVRLRQVQRCRRVAVITSTRRISTGVSTLSLSTQPHEVEALTPHRRDSRGRSEGSAERPPDAFVIDPADRRPSERTARSRVLPLRVQRGGVPLPSSREGGRPGRARAQPPSRRDVRAKSGRRLSSGLKAARRSKRKR